MAAYLWIVMLFTFGPITQSGITTTATFGRHSDCSTGRGACSFSLSKFETGMYSRKTADNTVTLEIDNRTLKDEEQKKIAGKLFSEIKEGETPVFVQQESIALDSTAIENLNLNRKYNRIVAGNYPMQITKDKTEIVFQLKNTD